MFDTYGGTRMVTVALVLEDVVPANTPRLADQAGEAQYLTHRFPTAVGWHLYGQADNRWRAVDGEDYVFAMFADIGGRRLVAHCRADRDWFDGLPPSPASPSTFAFFRLGRELDRAAAEAEAAKDASA